MSAMPTRQPRAASWTRDLAAEAAGGAGHEPRGACARSGRVGQAASRTRFSFLMFCYRYHRLAVNRAASRSGPGRTHEDRRPRRDGAEHSQSPGPGDAARALRGPDAAPALRERGAGRLPRRRNAGVPASLHRRGGDRRRRLRPPAPDRLGDLDPPRARARARQGRRPTPSDGRALRQGATAAAAAAAGRCISTTARSASSAPTASSAPASATRSASAWRRGRRGATTSASPSSATGPSTTAASTRG